MIRITIAALTEYSGGRFFGNEEVKDREICGITFDSREVRKDFCFACIKGERTDGHNYIAKAREAGAAVFICERKPDAEVPYILVENTGEALRKIAEEIMKKAGIPVVSISGSVGKTSTKEMIAAVMSEKFKVLKTQGNHNNGLGVPITVFDLEAEHTAAVIELGVSMPGDMDQIARIARPDICLLTNIGDCHLENLGSREGIYKEKSHMFDFMKKGGHIVLNGDDPLLKNVKEAAGCRPLFFGMGENCSVRAENAELNGILGSEADFIINDAKIHVQIPAPGFHMVMNALAAAAVGSLLGIGPEAIAKGILNYKGAAGRFNTIKTENYLLIDDCYNANPMSMKAALELLSMADGRKAAVLGDMGELGPDSEKLHYEIGKFAAEKNIDLLICAGKLSENIVRGAEENGSVQIFYYPDTDSLAENISGLVKKGDTVLVKASHFMHFEKIVEALK